MSTEPIQRKPNRLIHEKSPYLLQHAYNPVDWYPWSDEAFAKAKEENKPVFVSIGYSTCHWCHVMEKECFDDKEVAKLMNETFVSIKVDREERPDLDGTYMTMCQVMGRNCGWPLNVVMTPEKNVFFVASYIPKSSKFSSVGMTDLVPQIREVWLTRRLDIEKTGEEIKRRIQTLEDRPPEEMPGLEILHEAYQKLVIRFDAEHGGFGNVPKFPTPHNLLFLLRYWNRTREPKALLMVKKTLSSMRLGGIFDQLGFGFHRYSTDAQWLVPHFEKMLYDQALLVLAYLEAYQATGTDKFRTTAKEILEYVMRDLTSPEGGYYAAEDADSEGEEGKFYLWSEPEIREALSRNDAELAVKLFGVKAQDSFEPGTKHSGSTTLHFVKPLEDLALDFKVPVNVLTARIDRIQKQLHEARERRPHPPKDVKILTDWNGLMISALARASQVLCNEKYLKAAIEAANFVLQKMKDKDGTLYHRYVKGERAVEGFLDDYAFLAFGLVEIYEASFDSVFLQAAVELTEKMVALFWDEKNGGFFFTRKDSVDVELRRKETYDGALPSGNSLALFNLLRLARLSENTRFEELAKFLIRAFSSELQESPSAHTFMLIGLDFIWGPVCSVTLVGEKGEQSTKPFLEALRSNYLPNTLVLLKAPSKSGLDYGQINGRTTAYVCRGQICLPPTNGPKAMLELLEKLPEES